MATPDEDRQALSRLFQRRKIADLDHLFAALDTRSRMTVFRRLSPMGYVSSYSHAGRYYTLRDIPVFDPDGLWQHAGVLFSRDGTLKKTVVRLVEEADAGQFHRELHVRLRLRVHNTLADLIAQQRLGREPLDAVQPAETPLEQGDLLVAVQPIDLEGGLGVDLAHRAIDRC